MSEQSGAISWRDVAWYFEGEGSVGYYKASARKRHILFVRLSSSNKALLDEIRNQLIPDAAVSISTKAGSTSGGVLHKKSGFNLVLCCDKALIFLSGIAKHLPDCSEKLPQVKLALSIGKWTDGLGAGQMKTMKHLPYRDPPQRA